MSEDPILEARDLSLEFGGLKALTDFSLTLGPGELVGLIGPNGAGKTSVFNILTGIYAPNRGWVRLGGQDCDGLPPHAVARLGLSRTFQNIRLFKDLTALENVSVSPHKLRWTGLWRAFLRTPGVLSEEGETRNEALRTLALVGLESRAGEIAKNLSYGDQRRLEIARALASGAKALLLDEPAAGMSSQERVDLMDLIRRLRGEFGRSILLIEHDMRVVMEVCDRILVLDHGVTIAHGTPSEIQRNPDVIKAYLGEGEASPAVRPPAPALKSKSQGSALLSIHDLHVHYGPIHAVRGISLELAPGEAVALVGGNGAGKSSTLRAISGLVRPSAGVVRFDGGDLKDLAPHELARRGLVQAPEGRGIFLNLTVQENLDLGRAIRPSSEGLAEDEASCFALFPVLEKRLHQLSGTLSGGEQQMLALARALLAKPRLLILDEPSLGLAPQFVTQIFAVLADISSKGVSILLVEQNAAMALRLASRAYVMETGEILLSGPSGTIAADPRVREAYLGG